MAAISHPNLAPIHGVEFWRGAPILVIEYLGGGTLADRLRQRGLGWETALDYLAQLAGAVERIHGAGLLHGDIKPENIAFAEDGTPKLLDFGLARGRTRSLRANAR